MERRFIQVGFLAAVALLLLPAISHAQSGQTTTLSSQYIFWDQLPSNTNGEALPECETDLVISNNGTGGLTCYSKQVTVPSGANTLLVNVSANGEVVDDFEALEESVNLGTALAADGTPCVNGASDIPDLAATGWIPLLKISDDDPTFIGDFARLVGNSSYTWCCQVPKPPAGTTAKPFVNVKFGSTHGDPVEAEEMTVTIQAAGIAAANACTGSFFLP